MSETSTVDGGGGPDAPGTTDGPTASAGPVSGPADTHCTEADGGKIVQPTNAASCFVPADGGTEEEEYPPTLFNSEGDDDDCKYHVKWSATTVRENSDVTITLTATKRTDDSPLTGAAPRLEVFLDDTHPAPNTNQTATEGSPGTYTIGPVQFDAPGRWTVRFHFFETCTDAVEDTPHGHAAFFVDVP